MTNSLFEPPFVKIRGNVQTSSYTARLKARSRLSISDNWTFSPAFLRLRRYKHILVEVGTLQRGCVTLVQILGRRGRRPQPLLVSKNYSDFVTPKWKPRNLIFIRLNKVPACDEQTDGQTDRRNCRNYYSTLYCKQCGRAIKMVK